MKFEFNRFKEKERLRVKKSKRKPMTADEKKRYDYLTFIRYSFFCCLTNVFILFLSHQYIVLF